MWGLFIVVFAGIWLLQIAMTKVQLKNYQATIKKMSSRPSGYLGVGIQKQKFGIGVISIVVTDKEGVVVENQLMRGVTVFSRFEPFTDYNGLHIEALKQKLDQDLVSQAIKKAIEKVEAQMDKEETIAV